MKKILVTMAAAAAVALTSFGAMAEDKLKVGFIYIGPPGDHGWTYQHDQGRIAVEDALGGQVETTFVENVPEGPDAERVIRRLAEDGHGLIFTTSFGYMNPTLKVAKKFPDVKFEHATGYKQADNVSTYSGRFYEGRYVIGKMAGHLSKTGVVGYVASFPIPEVVRGINSFILGMQTVNPDAQIKVVWVNSWFDPGKEADAAKALIDQGADIITQHTDSPAPMQVAEQRGIMAFGQASDMIHFGPKAQATSIIDDWAPYYIARTQAVLDGTWESQDTFGGLAEGMVQMAPYTNVSDEVAALGAATADAIASGAMHPFQGPIYNQAGELKVAEGEILPIGDLLGMNWYVQGVDDQLPE